MIARIQKSINEKDDKGFTLIELLVVMIIIGILAAVAIPIFLSQREKAQDSAAKADVSTLGKEVATYYVDNTGAVTIEQDEGAYTVDGESVGNSSANVVLDDSTSASDSDDWCVAVTNDKGDKAVDGFRYSNAGGLEEGVCP